MHIPFSLKNWHWGVAELLALAATACAGAARATPAPTTAATSTPAPQVTAGPTPTSTVAAIVTPLPSGITSARDSITLVVPEEPIQLSSLRSIGAALNQQISKDDLVDPLTWQSWDDQRIVPTSATTGWEQLDPDTWRFTLRQGVKFHNGEAWNAEAALPSLEYLGVPTNDNPSYPYTGGYTAEAVDEYTVDINCEQACPIFPTLPSSLTLRPRNT